MEKSERGCDVGISHHNGDNLNFPLPPPPSYNEVSRLRIKFNLNLRLSHSLCWWSLITMTINTIIDHSGLLLPKLGLILIRQ